MTKEKRASVVSKLNKQLTGIYDVGLLYIMWVFADVSLSIHTVKIYKHKSYTAAIFKCQGQVKKVKVK